ncbi:MAG TPA: HD domain-containing phosphohydrolase [Terriglobales bacterium]|nr:HD domain-containing phosphohydrolase [Terriglobales bacterium]
MSFKDNNFRRMLMVFEAMADLGSLMTADRDFPETAGSVLSLLMDSVDAQEGAIFVFRDKPAMLSSIVSKGFATFPEQAVIPLLPKHVHALNSLRAPLPVSAKSYEGYLTANGNVAPELFRCIVPLRVGNKLVGMTGLGRRSEDAIYSAEDMEALRMLCHYVALGVHNYMLAQSLAQRVSDHLRLLASVQSFYDNALETFANAIDIKHINIRGHSLRVGRYAAAIGDAMNLDAAEVTALRASGYLHDIGKVAVDKALFGKPSKLNAAEFREMADHTIIGHQIVHGVQFPWPNVPEVVRNHHERADGSGYPDKLHLDEMSSSVRVIGLADTFDAMTSERPYRQSHSVGEALSEIIRQTPTKFDPAAVQALLIQVRREAVGNNKTSFLDPHVVCNIAPSDVDVLASMLNHRLTNGRIYSA